MRTIRRPYPRISSPEFLYGLSGPQFAILGMLVATAIGLSGCGAGTATLPGNLPPGGGGGSFAITTTTLPDAVAGRSYTAAMVTNSSTIFLSFGQDSVSACTLSGSFPSGMVVAPGAGKPTSPATRGTNDQCILSMTSAAAAKAYSFSVSATDIAVPPKTLSQTLILTIRPEFSFVTNTGTGAPGAIPFPDGVVGRSYGSPANVLSAATCAVTPCAPEPTSLSSTTPPVTTPSGTPPSGNGPVSACAITAGTLNLVTNPDNATKGTQCLVSSAALSNQVGKIPVTVSATDNPIYDPSFPTQCSLASQANCAVPSNTITTTTSNGGTALTLNVNPEITFSATTPSFTSANNFPDGVDGRTYGAPAKTSIVYTAQGGLMNAAIGLKGLIIWLSGGAFPAPITCPNLGASQTGITSVSITCDSGNQAMTATPGPYNFSISVSDKGNTATPQNTIAKDTSGNASYNIKVDAALAATATQATNANPYGNLIDGVVGRSYGVAPLATPTYTASGGLGTGTYEWCLKAGSLPGGFTPPGACTAPTVIDTLTLTSTNVTGPANPNPYSFTLQLDDPGNTTTPGSQASNTSSVVGPTGLLIHPVLAASVAQLTNANPSAALLDGALNRSYGVKNSNAGAPTYSATGGLASSGAYLWCISAGALPNGFGGISTSCGQGTSTPAATVQLTANQVGGTVPTYLFQVQADDGGNPAVPPTFQVPASDSTVPPGSGTTSLTIHPQITVNLNLSPPPNAVTGRTYGGPALTDLIYTVPSTSPTEGVGAITMTGSGFPAPITCTQTLGTQLNCDSAGNPVAGTTSAGTVTAVDAANSAVPPATPGTDPHSQRIDTITVNLEMVFVQQPASLADAVVTRNYGLGGNCSGSGGTCVAPVYQIQTGSGLGGYGFTANNFPTNFVNCVQSPATTVTCTSGGVGTTPNTYNGLSVTFADTANATTPSNSVTSNALSVVIHPEMTYSAQPATPYPIAVINRAYGQGSGCTVAPGTCLPLTFTVASGSGLSPYTFTQNNFPLNWVTCAQSPNDTDICSSAVVTATQGTYTSLSVTANDMPNVSTPIGTLVSTAANLQVNNQLSVNPPTPYVQNPLTLAYQIPDAVAGRPYGIAGGGTQDLTYTVSSNEGVPTVTIAASAFPAPFQACNSNQYSSSSDSAVTLTCNSGGAAVTGGTSTGTVIVSDGGNSATPKANTTTDPGSTRSDLLTVDPEIVIQNTPGALSNGQLLEPYSVLFTCQSSGACGGTGNPASAQAMFTWTATSNNVTGVNFSGASVAQPGNAAFAGTPTIAGLNEGVTISVIDNGNATTPSCTTAGTCPTPQSYTVNVLTSALYVDATNNAIDVFDTSNNGFSLITSIAPAGGSTPTRAAASPNGTYVFVADPGSHKVFIINNTLSPPIVVKTVPGLPSSPGDTADIAIGPKFAPDNSHYTPDSVWAYVANPGSDNIAVIDGDPASPNFGTLDGFISFTGGPYLGNGASDLKITPTRLVGGVRQTRGYVVRPGGDEVCIFDAEPTSATFLAQIAPAQLPNLDNCITVRTAVQKFIEISPDGQWAAVSETAAGLADVALIAIGDGYFGRDNLVTFVDTTTTSPACDHPEDMRATIDAQWLWLACSDVGGHSQLLPIQLSTDASGVPSFAIGTAVVPNPDTSGAPIDIAFRSDGVYGFTTLSAANRILPFLPATSSGAAEFGTPTVTGPQGVEHTPNPSLHITTTTLPPAKAGKPYFSSIVAEGLTQGYTFTEDPSDPNSLASLGITMTPDGMLYSAGVGAAGPYTFTITVTDQSLPVPNQVTATVSLTIGP
ncbi:MAG: hypothetical protein ABSB82_09160 [Terriglobia bacterium]